jgi:hypothetical protein
MERFGAIAAEVEKGVDQEGEEFVFLFPAEEGVAREYAMKVKAEVLACAPSLQKEVQSAMRKILLEKMNKCFTECPPFIVSRPESVNTIVRGMLLQTYYDELADVMRDMGILKKLTAVLGEDVVKRLRQEDGAAGALREFFKVKGVEEGVVVLRKRVDEAFVKALVVFTPSVREFMEKRQDDWTDTEGADVVLRFLRKRSWTVAPLSEPQGQEEAKTWERFENHFGDGVGDAAAQLNERVEAEWEVEKSSLAGSFATLGTDDLNKMKKCFVKDIYYLRARAVLGKEPGDDSSSAPLSPVPKKTKSNETEGSKKDDPKDGKQAEEAKMEKKSDKKASKERAPPASPGAAKKAKDSKLDGKRTVGEMLAFGISQGTATGVSGQVYVIDHCQSKVLSLTCMDATMVVQLIVAKELMTQVASLLKEWATENVDVPALVNFKGGKLKTGDGQPNTHVRIELEVGAVMELAKEQDERTWGCDVAAFDGSHFLTVFAGLSGCTPPFILTAEGVIFKFSNSSAGTGQNQGFYLQDENTDVLKFLAHGAWAESEVLKIGNRVRIFFAKAQYGRGEYTRQVTLWIFEDAYVHVLGTDQPIKREGRTITIG